MSPNPGVAASAVNLCVPSAPVMTKGASHCVFRVGTYLTLLTRAGFAPTSHVAWQTELPPQTTAG